MIVVDANVALKWFLPEEYIAEAFQLLRCGRKLVAPGIMREEVVSGLVRRVRREELSSKEAEECVRQWVSEVRAETVYLFDDDELLVEASALGFELKHPLFDCIYLALANRLDVPLVSADRTLLQRAGEAGYAAHHLGELDAVLAA